MDTPWNRARKTASVRQEERLGQLPGGRQGVNSGRFWRFKRDGSVFDYLTEARTTDKGSYSISYSEFQSLIKEAFMEGKLPSMQIDIKDLSLMVVRLEDWIDQQARLANAEDDEN